MLADTNAEALVSRSGEYSLFVSTFRAGDATAVRQFEQRLSDTLRRGWSPVGGISVTLFTDEAGVRMLTLCQAIISA
jgi:hypothetical protein